MGVGQGASCHARSKLVPLICAHEACPPLGQLVRRTGDGSVLRQIVAARGHGGTGSSLYGAVAGSGRRCTGSSRPIVAEGRAVTAMRGVLAALGPRWAGSPLRRSKRSQRRQFQLTPVCTAQFANWAVQTGVSSDRRQPGGGLTGSRTVSVGVRHDRLNPAPPTQRDATGCFRPHRLTAARRASAPAFVQRPRQARR